MKCYCHIQGEISRAISAIWCGSLIAFIWTFFIPGTLSFTFEHLIWWWAVVLSLRFFSLEPLRFILIHRKGKKAC